MNLPPEVVRALHQHYHTAWPRECCGFLLGPQYGGEQPVHLALPVLNAEPGTGAFAIPDSELRRVRQHARDNHLHIRALYHSHPSGSPAPSVDDAQVMARSEWPWLILTCADRDEDLQLHWYGKS